MNYEILRLIKISFIPLSEDEDPPVREARVPR